MARENIIKFEELIRTDEALRARLQELVGVFRGDKADEKAFFAATVGKLSKEAGLPFSYEESVALLADGELSDAELEAVAGGYRCLIIGASDEPEAQCKRYYGTACSYIGVTLK